MSTNPVLKRIRDSVKELSRRGGMSEERAFAAWYAITFFDVDEDVALESAALDGDEDQGIDFLFVDNTNERVILLQAHLPANTSKATPKSKFDSLVSVVAAIGDSATFKKAGRVDLAKAADDAQRVIVESEYEALVYLISFGGRSDQIVRLAEGVNRLKKMPPWRFSYQSLEDITEQFEAIETGGDSVAEDCITFQDGRYFEDKGDYGRAYVGSLTAQDLCRLYERHKERLFSRNVRLYLGTRKGGINEQIVNTAREMPGKFWALNNGITIVADNIAPEGDGKFTLRRFSIVNGCQTTVSLSRAIDGEVVPNAKVLARVVAANRNVTGEIVRYNNTQNAIRIWTVRASDPVQSKLRRAFQSHGIEYAPKPENRRRSSKVNIFMDLDRVAQYLAAADTTIIDAINSKAELFDRHYQQIFPIDIEPDEVLLHWLIGVSADEFRQERLGALKSQGDADQLMTALLGVPGTLWTCHCAIKLVNGLNPKPRRLNIDAMLHDNFKFALKKYITEALDAFLELAIDSYSPEEHATIRQALRSPKFLQKIDLKLANRVAKLKSPKAKLPLLETVVKSIPPRASPKKGNV